MVQNRYNAEKAFKKFQKEHQESDIQEKITGYHITSYGICIELADKTGIPYVC